MIRELDQLRDADFAEDPLHLSGVLGRHAVVRELDQFRDARIAEDAPHLSRVGG